MASGFSGVLKLTDLNDYITPSQMCIKPIQGPRTNSTNTTGIVKINTNTDSLNQNTTVELTKAKISLTDCLACSGCVTSAESVLISSQSHEEFLKCLQVNKTLDNVKDQKLFILTISPQSVTSIAVAYNLSVEIAALKLSTLFRQLGVAYVFDSSFARSFSLIETAKEFVQRYNSEPLDKSLPMFTSACPGWVCYAEKTHGDYILPFISDTKSPQQISGSLVKYYLSEKLNTTPDKIYHLTLMPCFDKKLEASRNDFYSDIYQTRDVDLVLTSVEVELMLKELSIDFQSCQETNFDTFDLSSTTKLINHRGSSAGGYLEYTLIYAAKMLFNCDVDEINFSVLRNKDMKEVNLVNNGVEVLKFAQAYGFRNIQNVIQKMKRGKSPYHFVEIMACPSACVNGGGQIRPSESIEHKEHLDLITSLYGNIPLINPEDDKLIQILYRDWLNDGDSEKVRLNLHTSYHSVPKTIIPLTIKW